MSEKLEIKITDSKSIVITAVSDIKIQKVYKTRIDNTYEDVYVSSFIISDSSIRINVGDFNSLIVIYEKMTNTSILTYTKGEISYKNRYSISAIKKELHGSNSIILNIKDTSGINISANVIVVAENGDSLEYDYIVSGEYAISDRKREYSSYNNSLIIHDTAKNITSYAYIPEQYVSSGIISATNGVVSVLDNIEYSIYLTVNIFTTNGLDIVNSPVIKMIGVKRL